VGTADLRRAHERGPLFEVHGVHHEKAHMAIDAGAGVPTGGRLLFVIGAHGEHIGGLARTVAPHTARDLSCGGQRHRVAGESVTTIGPSEVRVVNPHDGFIPIRTRGKASAVDGEDGRKALVSTSDINDGCHLDARRQTPIIEPCPVAGGQSRAAIGIGLPVALCRNIGFLPHEAGDVVEHRTVA